MSGNELTQIFENAWIVGLVAFVLGLFIGWAIWGASSTGETDDHPSERAEPSVKSGDNDTAADPRLGSIEAELEKARGLLSENAEADNAFSDELEALDQAIKRANGRLKLILKAADKAKDA